MNAVNTSNGMKKILLVSALWVVSGCASINSVSLTPIPASRSQKVEAEVSKTIFLGFNFDNDFIDPLVEDLKGQCPGGVVSGILTKDETISYFIVFTKRVTATGYCQRAVASAAGAAAGASGSSGAGAKAVPRAKARP